MHWAEIPANAFLSRRNKNGDRKEIPGIREDLCEVSQLSAFGIRLLESEQRMYTYSRCEVSKFLSVNRGGIPYLANISTPQYQQTSTAGSVACGWENLSKFLSTYQFIYFSAHRKLSSLHML